MAAGKGECPAAVTFAGALPRTPRLCGGHQRDIAPLDSLFRLRAGKWVLLYDDIAIFGGKYTMNKPEFVALVAEKAGTSRKDADIAIDAVLSAIEDVLTVGDKLSLPKFGTFEVRHRAARKGHDVRTGEPTDIPACWVPVFRPNAQLKGKVNHNAAG